MLVKTNFLVEVRSRVNNSLLAELWYFDIVGAVAWGADAMFINNVHFMAKKIY